MASTNEERLLTLYADVHYYFDKPGPRPSNHRFDKESYVYLYHDKSSGRGRIEIANHAGTPEQDAFTGFLDNVTIEQTFRHPALCVLTVNSAGSTPQPDNHWRLPSTDPRDEGNYLFRLHTVDLYFWTEADAAQFVNAVASVLRQEQLRVDGPPVASPPAHEEPMSPVVQNLENMAVSHGNSQAGSNRGQPSVSPGHHQQQAQGHNAGVATAAAAAAAAATATAAAAAAPSPHQTASRGSGAASSVGPTSPTSPAGHDQNYVPLAYNPAAPAAPEKHAHREKTPPPPEGAEGTGLADAAARDAGRAPVQQPRPSFGPTATPSFGPGAPSTISPQGHPGHMDGHSPAGNSQMGHTYTPTQPPFSTAPTSSSTVSPMPMSPSSQTSHGTPSFPGPPSRSTTDPNLAGSVQSSGPTPTDEILGPDFRHSGVPLQHLQPQYPDYLAQRVSQNTPPSTHSTGYHAVGQKPSHGQKVPDNVRIGGYSDYNYSSPPPQHTASGYHDSNPYQTGDYAIHQQAYRPTEDEVDSHRRNSKHKADGEARAGRLEQGAEKVEKKVNRFLRGIEKRIG